LAGRDILRGGSGDDLIRGGRGADHLWGGAGRDKILVRDSARDFVSCGSGVDLVLADHRDAVKPDCEQVHRG
jgi:Ca2+-binding RTX toxin-like protein